jgi:hypothetical protein
VYWTPAWWGFEGGLYGFHAGYWGPQVGYYGGINYGFGYTGIGFGGGLWVGGHFSYNSAVNNFGGIHVTNVYVNRSVIVGGGNHASFNGPGGWNARPTPEQTRYASQQHIQPTAAQQQHFETAHNTPAQRFSANGGRPGVTAASSPAAFHEQAAHLPATANRGGFGNNAARPAAENGARPGGAAPVSRPAAQPAGRPQGQPGRPAAQPRQAAPKAAPRQQAPKAEPKEHK